MVDDDMTMSYHNYLMEWHKEMEKYYSDKRRVITRRFC